MNAKCVLLDGYIFKLFGGIFGSMGKYLGDGENVGRVIPRIDGGWVRSGPNSRFSYCNKRKMRLFCTRGFFASVGFLYLIRRLCLIQVRNGMRQEG